MTRRAAWSAWSSGAVCPGLALLGLMPFTVNGPAACSLDDSGDVDLVVALSCPSAVP